MKSIHAFILSMPGRLRRPLLVTAFSAVAIAVPALSLLSASGNAGEISIEAGGPDLAAVQQTFCTFAIQELQGDAATSYVAARPDGDTVVMFFDEEHPGSIRCEFETAEANNAIRLSAVMFDAEFIAPAAVRQINGAFAGERAGKLSS